MEDRDFKKAEASWGFVENCVAVARKPEGVALRDTKDPSKTTLFFSNDEWNAFLDGAKKGEFNITT